MDNFNFFIHTSNGDTMIYFNQLIKCQVKSCKYFDKKTKCCFLGTISINNNQCQNYQKQ
jgi:hypothetical protein